MLRLGLWLLLPALASSGLSEVDRSHCPSSCNHRGTCLRWPTESHFPALCICDKYFEGHECERRQPNPFPATSNTPTDEMKHQQWRRDAGVSCGSDRHAPDCSHCIPSGASRAQADVVHLCGGECAWRDLMTCASPQYYSPYRLYHWLYGNGNGGIMPKNSEPIKPLRPRQVGRGRGGLSSRSIGRLSSAEKVQRLNGMVAAKYGRLFGHQDPLRRGSARGGAGGGRGLATRGSGGRGSGGQGSGGRGSRGRGSGGRGNSGRTSSSGAAAPREGRRLLSTRSIAHGAPARAPGPPVAPPSRSGQQLFRLSPRRRLWAEREATRARGRRTARGETGPAP